MNILSKATPPLFNTFEFHSRTMKVFLLLLLVAVAAAAPYGESEQERDLVEQRKADFNLRDLKKTVDPDLLKEKIEKIFGQGSELLDQLLQTLREKGHKKMLILIDTLLGDDDDDEGHRRSERGISDYWQKIKDYFKDLQIDLKEKYAKFGEWVKDKLGKGMEHSKDKMQNIKAIAGEFLKHAKGISKEIAAEAGEFFKNYKEDLGNVWDEIKEKINEIRNRND
ncbi:uncharacterized protein CEXT_424131 [Caerostris extrusa]|uniref:Uncharacterized protein n=1 Tax=Caerostris extrusa TaxID=172846 RepID=A0AAV4M5G3_CAEEX|nr:uncharacterized protein CEXT_424131 [Caerostris extrusa]